MKQSKQRNPPMSERNAVQWTYAAFPKAHCKEPELNPWTAHEFALVIALLVTLAFVAVGGFVKVIRAPLLIAELIMFTALVILCFRTDRRNSGFYRGLLDRGGKIVEPWNYVILRRHKYNMFAAGFLALLACVFFGFVIYRELSGTAAERSGHFQTAVFPIYMFNIYSALSRASGAPFIFLDIDEGMLFGGAVFGYDVLSGIYPTGDGSKFELHYGGELVARGNMLPGDMQFLRAMIDTHAKYCIGDA
jgi:hypothetical protein